MAELRGLAALCCLGAGLFSSAIAMGDDAWELPKLPAHDFPNDRDWYPLPARAQGVEGRVLLGFDISSDGRTKKISVIWAENGDNGVLATSARQMLTVFRFRVPADWAESGAWRRWRLGFVYRLFPSGQALDFAIPVEPVVITGSRLRGAPVRSKPAPGESGGVRNR